MQVIAIHLFKDRVLIPWSAPQRKILHECIHVINPAHSHHPVVCVRARVRARAHVRVIARVCACVRVQCGVPQFEHKA